MEFFLIFLGTRRKKKQQKKIQELAKKKNQTTPKLPQILLWVDLIGVFPCKIVEFSGETSTKSGKAERTLLLKLEFRELYRFFSRIFHGLFGISPSQRPVPGCR